MLSPKPELMQPAVHSAADKATAAVTKDDAMERGHPRWLAVVLAIVLPIVVIAVWQFVYDAKVVSPLVIPRPLDVVTALWSGLVDGVWWRHIAATIQATVLAFAVGFLAAIVVGSCFAFSALARETLYPYIIAIQSFPKVAVAPLLVVWLGYGLAPKVAIGGLLAFFPIFTSTLAGLLEVDRDEVDLFKSVRARWYHQLRYLRIPNALSYIFPALNVAAVNALLGVIVGELVGTDAGLGYLISQKSFLGDTAGVFGVLTLLALIGVSMFVLIRLAERATKFSR
ncbi:ABC transporter permease [Ferrovibrio sp.]|uniref:ABC transporter permease n=1 Tax=Ferrovibrio sp. TaxID=1917215 RepID=UPI000CC70A9B|nr:ABC transporter permease [Ferrovibrio sp.]PJI38778.1 MAG: ABC transporter permease [Ferrovibrio sp.]